MISKKQKKYVRELVKKCISKYKEQQFLFFPNKTKEVNMEYIMNCGYDEINKLIKDCWNLLDERDMKLGLIERAISFK